MAQASTRSSNRERILDCAEAAVLDKGFSATSIEELIVAVGITKSGFFYHFRDKATLARALIERHVAREAALVDAVFGRAADLTDDPLQAFLVALKLLAEAMADLKADHPGCIVAACCYQDQVFNREVREAAARGAHDRRARLRGHLDRVANRYPPCADVDLDSMADMLTALIGGSIILSRLTGNPNLLADQIMAYRSFVTMVFVDRR